MTFGSNYVAHDRRFAPSPERARVMDRSRSPTRKILASDTGNAASAAPSIPPVKCWVFAKPVGPPDGAVQTVQLSFKSEPIGLRLEGAHSPFDASSLDGNPRKTLTLRLTKQWEEAFECMEACLLERVANNSQEVLGRDLPAEQVQEMYKSICKKTGEYPANLRVKVNTTGAYPTRYWNTDKTRADPPEDHACATYNARVILRALWLAGDAWGLVCDATDLQSDSGVDAECPF